MPGSKNDIGWVLIVLGFTLLPLLPLVVQFRWLEPKNGSRAARWLLWALVAPGEVIALTFIYIGLRPLLVGMPVVGSIDEVVRIVVDRIIVATLIVLILDLSAALVIVRPTYPLPLAHVPPELTYEHWRERRQMPPVL